MSNTVQPSIFINYISEWKKIFITQNGGAVNQLFKIDSNISDEYYFQIRSRSNQPVSLSGRTFQIYGSYEDSKNITHILFYTPSGTIETNDVLHFHINTYNQQYLNQIKTTKQANITIVETTGGDTQVVLRDVCLCYKRPYIDNVVPAEVYTVRILTGSLPWQNEFGAGQNINLIEGTPNYAFGSNLSTASNQFVIGYNNEPDATKAFIVANSGNIFTVDLSGNVEAGDLDVGAISATSITVSGEDLNQVIDDKVEYLSAATDDKLEAVSSAIPSIEGLASEQWVQEQGYLTAHQSLDGYATEQWVLNKGYITGYTAGSGIQINNNVISLTGQLGETYTADNDTLKLVNNQFSIKSVFPMIKSAGGVTITKDSEGITYLKVTTSGGGGGSSTEYFAGTGLELGSDPELPETTFSINTTWLAAQISAATSGLENYSAGTGISIDANNVISVTGMVTTDQIVNMATTGWVTDYCSSFITESAIEGLATESDLQIVSAAIPTDYLVQDDLSSYVTSAALTGELDNYVLKTDLPNDIVTSSDITGFITSGWLEENGYATSGDLNDLSTTLSSALTSNVETLSTAIDTKTTAQQVTGLITGYVAQNLSAVSQLVNDTGFITLASLDDYAQLSDIPVVTDFVTEDELSNTSTAIVNLIPDTSDLATEQDLQAVSAVVSAKADKSYVDQTFLSAIPDEYVTATELATELQPYALSANVDTSIAAATGTVTSWVDEKGYLTAHQDLTNYATNDNVTAASANAVNVATGWVAEQDYLTAHQSLDNYYNKTEVDTAIETASGNIETWVGQQGYLTAHQSLDGYATQQWVEDKHYLTGVDLTNYATKSQIPTKVSELENDKGYITGITSAQVTDALGFTPVSTDTTYTAGTGLELNGTEFSLTAQIPTDGDISGIASAVTTGYLEDYDTSTEVDDKITAAIAQIDFPEGVNYTAGEGLGLSSTQNGKEFYLTAHIPTNDEITGLASSYVDTLNIATTYATKDELSSKANQNDFASVCGVLSGAIDLKANSADVYTALSADQTFATKSELQTVSSAIPTATISAITVVHEADEDYTYNTDTIKFNSDFNVDDNGDSVSINWSGFDVYPAQGDSWKTKCIEFTNDFVAQSSEEWLTLSINTDILSSYALKTDIPTATVNTLTGNVEFLSGAIDYVSGVVEAIDIPTKISDLENDSEYATSGNVETIIADTSATIINGLATQSYVTTQIANTSANIIDGLASESYVTTQIQNTSASIINGLASEEYVGQQIAGTSATIINGLATESYVGTQITNTVDATYVSNLGFATTTALADKADQSEFASVCGVLSGAIDLKANSADVYTATSADSTFLKISNYIAPTAYTAGTGLKLTGSEFSLSAAGSNENKVLSSHNGTIVWADNVAAGGNYSEGTGIDISAQDEISVDTTWLSGQISGQVSGEINDAASAAVENYITASGVVAGTGLEYDQTDNSLNVVLSAAQNGNIDVSVDENGVILLSAAGTDLTDYYTKSEINTSTGAIDGRLTAIEADYTTSVQVSAIARAYASEATPSVDTICGMLSSANENLTISKSNDKILFTATGGGGGSVNLSGGSGIKVSVIDGTYVISIPTANITASSASLVFDRRLISTTETSSVLYTQYTGEDTVNVSYTGTLPNGITTTSVNSGIQFIATKNDMNNNSLSSVYVTFDALDAKEKTVKVDIQTIGYTSATLNVSSIRTFEYSANNSSTTSALSWTYDGVGLDVQVSGELPAGITTGQIANNQLPFIGNGTTFTENGTYTVNVIFNAIDIEPQTVQVSIVISDVLSPSDTPLTIKSIGNTTLSLATSGTGLPSYTLSYNKNGSGWNTYSSAIDLTDGDAVQLSGTGTWSESNTDEKFRYLSASGTGTQIAFGNILSLVTTNLHATSMNNTLKGVFYNNKNLVDASEVIIDLTSLNTGHFSFLFRDCSSLTAAPAIPSALADFCYYNTFRNCSALLVAPELPQRNLVNSCYYVMFSGCKSLTAAPELPATTLTTYCYSNMFNGCSSLTHLKVGFTAWGGTNNGWTGNWLADTGAGTFECPAALDTSSRTNSTVPSNWTIQTY